MQRTGQIVKIISNLFTVKIDGNLYDCRARGKFRNTSITPLVGDFVVIDDETNYILNICERKNCLSRPAIANVDIGLIITSCKDPDLSLLLLDKEILTIVNLEIEPVIILTKTDLLSEEELNEIKLISAYYETIGYCVLTNKEPEKIIGALKNKTVVLTGQTGAGKSTLLNILDTSLNLKTSPISKALGRGVHTTRHTEIHEISGIKFADTPGFSALDLAITPDRLKELYPEFLEFTCRFQDCAHDKEIGCGVKEAFENGKILKSRYENYLKIRGELK